ncbi:MAG: hypothetical protein FJ008_02070 [Chloroflexi bacterium]|nr:hypothetical protein [Chloroflexota bacterium]MBM3154101.1 hypothetical protein [Chloroflexota bacterium]MBM3172385.1 hypothetical protein [Chloroflexota bacterium]MBM3174811.1 hypothetical protein [Chloroflexota bacterium]MBM4449979.1 hypothetical protein [Chloroflexota bacterium]
MPSLIQRRDSWLRKGLENSGSIYFFYRDVLFKYPFLRLFNVYLILRAKLQGTSIIHVIGDSHAMPFVFKTPFVIHHISQATAYNLNKENSFSRSKQHLHAFLQRINKRRDVLLLVFGEIDARVHIYSQYCKRNKAVNIAEIIQATVEKYGETIKKLRDQGFAVCIHGIPPAARKNYTSSLPFTGSTQERSQISTIFNRQLRNFCHDNAVAYIDVQTVSADDEGFISDEYAADDVHLSSKIVPLIREKITEAFGDKRF